MSRQTIVGVSALATILAAVALVVAVGRLNEDSSLNPWEVVSAALAEAGCTRTHEMRRTAWTSTFHITAVACVDGRRLNVAIRERGSDEYSLHECRYSRAHDSWRVSGMAAKELPCWGPLVDSPRPAPVSIAQALTPSVNPVSTPVSIPEPTARPPRATAARPQRQAEPVNAKATAGEPSVRADVVARCRREMQSHGAAMVKSCVDMDMEAYRALAGYDEKHSGIVQRCKREMASYGWAMVKSCADMDIDAEQALSQ